MDRESAKFNFNSASLFVAANLLAGVFNYLFQAIAGTQLDAAAFAQLNSWLAHVSIFFFLGGICQYLSLFGSMTQRSLRFLISMALLGLLSLTLFWLTTSPELNFTKALILLTGSIFYGWILGSAQKRMLFGAMAISSLIVGFAKIAILFIPGLGGGLSNYAFALFGGFVPAFLVLAVSLWNSKGDEVSSFSIASWNQTLILSLAAATFPQIDLILFHHTQTPALYEEFVRASLYFKAIYFCVFIFAQWLLPHQIQKQSKERFVRIGALKVLGLGIVGSVFMAATAPASAKLLFGWSESPEFGLVFLSSFNAVLLAWTFILLQGSCARHELSRAWSALTILGLGSLVQYLAAPQGYFYFALALTTAGLAVAALSRTK